MSDPSPLERVRSAPPERIEDFLAKSTESLWAMSPADRRLALAETSPLLITALVQNDEERNAALLNSVSAERFATLLGLCSPERGFWWCGLAAAQSSATAQSLPLTLPLSALVDILLSRPGFEDHCRDCAAYPIEHQRLIGDVLEDPFGAVLALLGPEQLLSTIPVADPELEAMLKNILAYQPELYPDMIRAGLAALDYRDNHPLEAEALEDTPVLVRHFQAPAAGGASTEDSIESAPDPFQHSGLAPIEESSLYDDLMGLHPEAARIALDELHVLYVRQAIAEGGSFLLDDLRNVIAQRDAYILLGLHAAGGTDATTRRALLTRVSIPRLERAGAQVLDKLRQGAIRLYPFLEILSPEQKSVVRSLYRPRVSVSPTGVPCIRMIPTGAIPEAVDADTAASFLLDVAGWASTAFALGISNTAAGILRLGSVERLLEELALGCVTYSRLEIGLAEAGDFARFQRQFRLRTGQPTVAARRILRSTVREWAADRGIPPETVLTLLDAALDRLADQTAARSL